MTVPTTTAFAGPYFPNGATVDFPFGFKVNYTDEVSAFYLEDDGTETIVPPGDYTIVLSSNENNPGGTLTFQVAPAATARPFYIALDPDFTQGTKFEDEGAFNQSILNPTFDAGALRSIWLRSRIGRALLAPFGEDGVVLPRAADRANFFLAFAADGSLTLSAGTGADSGLRVDLGDGDGDLIGVGGDATLKDYLQWLTPAYVGVPAGGNQNADVTVQMLALAALATATKLPIRLDARKYVVSQKLVFTTDVIGMGEGASRSLIQSSAAAAMNLSTHAVELAGRGMNFRNIRVDGNCSADPGVWNAGNHNSFTGSRGIRITAKDVRVEGCYVSNVIWAGVLVDAGAVGVTIENVEVTRCRGVFGDGFLFMGAYNCKAVNCRASDITRIGFVTDAYGDVPGQHCAQISFENCYAENAHDSSINYGGGDYNSGFWCEKSGGIFLYDCHAKNTGSRGFVLTAGENILSMPVAAYTAVNCTVDATQDAGFVVAGLAGVPVLATLTDCFVVGGMTSAYSFGGGPTTDFIRLVNCRSSLSGAALSRSSVKVSPGTTVIEGFTEVWTVTNAVARDAGDQYYSSVGHFADAVGKVIINDFKSLTGGGAIFPSVFKFLPETAATLDLHVERCYIRGVYVNALNYSAVDCIFDRFGSMQCTEINFLRGVNYETSTPFSSPIFATTKSFTFDGMTFDLVASGGRMHFNNIDSVSARMKLRFRQCTFIKDFSAGATPHAVQLTMLGGAAGAIAATVDANHIVASDCILIHTAGVTANPAFLIDSNTDAAGKLHGKGNYKSANLTNAIVAGKLAASASFDAIGT